MSDQEIQLVPFSEPSSDDVSITISPDSSNSASELEGMNPAWILDQPLAAASRRFTFHSLRWYLGQALAAASGRYFMSFTQGRTLSDRERWNALRQAVVTASPFPVDSPVMSDTQGRTLSGWEGWIVAMNFQGTLRQAAATGSEHVRMNSQQGILRQAVASSSELEGMYTSWILSQPLAAASGSEHVRMNSQQGTLRQAAASSRSLGDNIAVIGLIGATSAWLYGILFQLADKMHGSFFSHHRGMAMISGASMVYAAFSAVFLCVIFFLATADPTKTYRKRMRFLWGTYFYAACCGPAVLLMAMIDPSFGYKVLAWAVLGALFTPVGLYIGGYY